jgi:hypothetical protein
VEGGDIALRIVRIPSRKRDARELKMCVAERENTAKFSASGEKPILTTKLAFLELR